MHIVKLTDVESQPVAMEGVVGATRQVPLGVAHGVPTMSARVFTLEPGGHTPHHEHPFEHLNYVISGRGELQSEQGLRSIAAGDFILVDPHERHQYRNPHTEPLVFICLVPREYE